MSITYPPEMLPAPDGDEPGIVYVATVQGDCGIIHQSLEEWQRCTVCEAHLRAVLARSSQ